MSAIQLSLVCGVLLALNRLMTTNRTGNLKFTALFFMSSLLISCTQQPAKPEAGVARKTANGSIFAASRQTALYSDPQKSNRQCECQFGFDISIGLGNFKLGQFLDPQNLGHHSYSKPSSSEENGQLYTCEGGVVDSSHLRAGVDWTGHMALQVEKLLTMGGGVSEYPSEGGGVRLTVFKQKEPVSKETILRLAQRIAYERLIWHEVMSWYYHQPAHLISEQQSAFSPEDPFSNLLGTYIGREALLLVDRSPNMTFESAVDVVFAGWLRKLRSVGTTRDTALAFEAVDRFKQRRREGETKRLWYDSSMSFWDQRFLFKRSIDVLDHVTPWLVAPRPTINCAEDAKPRTLPVPKLADDEKTLLSSFYEFSFRPERKFFKNKTGAANGARHKALPEVVRSTDLPQVIQIIGAEMEGVLGRGFNDPGKQYPEAEAEDADRFLPSGHDWPFPY